MEQPEGISCVEGEYCFNFEAGYYVCRFECSSFYSHQAQNFCNSCKEMDFVLYNPARQELWLIEVKDYRFNTRPKVGELVGKLCRKVRDCLFLLRTAALCAPEEYPEEGISLRDMARMSLEARSIRLAFTIELGRTGLFPPCSMLSTIRDLLYRQMRFIDPYMICLPITQSGSYAPWSIDLSRGVKSSKIRQREDRLIQQRLDGERAQQRRHPVAPKETKVEKIPWWKKRAQARACGYKGIRDERLIDRPLKKKKQRRDEY